MTNPANGRKSPSRPFLILAAVGCSLATLSGALATLAAQQSAVVQSLA